MKKFTIEEKQILLSAMDHYIDAGEHTRHILTGEDKDKFTQELWKIRDLRIKLILDIVPLKVRDADDLFKRPCILCGNMTRGGSPKWAFVDNKKICEICFEKIDPTLYEVTEKFNKEYFIKEYPDQFNPDGTFKQGEVVSAEDSLPF